MTGKPDKAAEREWQKALDDHAHSVMSAAVEATQACMVLCDETAGKPTVEIMGPDGVWRRYYVRLTAAGPVLP